MVNVQKLKSKLVELGKNVEWLASEMKINVNTLYGRLKEPDKFTIGEVESIVRIMGLTSEEAISIFYAQIF